MLCDGGTCRSRSPKNANVGHFTFRNVFSGSNSRKYRIHGLFSDGIVLLRTDSRSNCPASSVTISGASSKCSSYRASERSSNVSSFGVERIKPIWASKKSLNQSQTFWVSPVARMMSRFCNTNNSRPRTPGPATKTIPASRRSLDAMIGAMSPPSLCPTKKT